MLSAATHVVHLIWKIKKKPIAPILLTVYFKYVQIKDGLLKKRTTKSASASFNHQNSGNPMTVLFVHGMGRSSLSGWPLLYQLRKAEMKTKTFNYSVAFERFDTITARLRTRIIRIAATGNYIVVGHSLGGVLLRASLESLPSGIALPQHVYLLGSPILPSRIARHLQTNFIYRTITGDCGQLLGSTKRMAAIGFPSVPITAIVGTRGIKSKYGPFGEDKNDGIVSISEVTAAWLSNVEQVPVAHTLLPASKHVAKIIIKDMDSGQSH